MKYLNFIHENGYKIFKSLITFVTFFCFGGVVTLLGSCLLDIQILANVDFSTVSYTIPIRSAGHIVGAGIAGIIDNRFSLSSVLCLTNLVSGVLLAIMLFFTNFNIIMFLLFIIGICHGACEIAANAIIIAIWEKKCANWLQVLQMSYGVGALLSPVICRPFLLPNTELEDDDDQIFSTNITLNGTTNDPRIVKIYGAEDVKVQYAFLILAICAFVVSLPFGFIHFTERKGTNSKSTTETADSPNTKQHYSLFKVYLAVFMVTLILHLVYAVESTIGTIGPAFAVKSDLHMDKKTGVLIATVFWTCFSFYRLIYIPLTFAVSEYKLLLTSLTVIFTGFLISVPWANYYTQCIWIGFTLIGIGISPIFSAAYGMLAQHIKLSSRMSSIIFMVGIFGESVHPAIAAKLIVYSPVTMLWFLGALGALLIIVYITLLVYFAKKFTATKQLGHETISRLSSIPSIASRS